jgi:hypothetical protein
MLQHVLMRGQDAGDFVTARGERTGETARHVAETAGLRERREFPAGEDQVQRLALRSRPRASRRQSTSNSSR